MDAETQPVAAPKRGRKPKVAADKVVQSAPSNQTAPQESAAPIVADLDPVAAAPEPQANLPADPVPSDAVPSETQIEAPTPKPRKKGWWNLGG
jgi:hypothetical protein